MFYDVLSGNIKVDVKCVSPFRAKMPFPLLTQPNFSRDFNFFGLGSRCAVLFFKFFKKVEEIEIEYADLRSKCSRIYSDTNLTAKQYHLEVILISE